MRLPLYIFPTLLMLLSTEMAEAQHYYYAPNSVNIPYLTQRHDAGLGFGWSRGSATKAIELQGYYSFADHFAIMANFMDAGEKEVLENAREGLKYKFYEFGAGVYEALPHGSASLFAGIGHGDMYNFFYGDEYVDLNLQRWFIQPSILYHDNFFQGGFSIRLSRLKYNSGRVAIAIPAAELAVIENIEKKSPFFLPEVGINGAMRVAPFLLGVTVSGIFPATENLNFARMISTVFIHVELGKLIRGKKKAPVKS